MEWHFDGLVVLLFSKQGKHDDLEAKFFEERAALEAKYQKLYQPLYAKVCLLNFVSLFLYSVTVVFSPD